MSFSPLNLLFARGS